jgi:signal recognition particle subunit SRP54
MKAMGSGKRSPLAGLGQMMGFGGGGQPTPEQMAELAKKMPGGSLPGGLPAGMPGAGAPGSSLPPTMPKLPNFPGLPGLGNAGKFPGLPGLPGAGKKK